MANGVKWLPNSFFFLKQPTTEKMNHYKTLTNSIVLTKDYPKAGILFADLNPMLAHMNDLTKLIEIWARNVALDSDCIIVGLPTRGIAWASILASVMKVEPIFLSKHKEIDGKVVPGSYVGTPRPGGVSIAIASRTVYSAENEVSVFSLHESDKARMEDYRNIVIVDDICESGTTLKSVREFFDRLFPARRIICMPVLDVSVPVPANMKDHCCPMISMTTTGHFSPGKGLSLRPDLLGTLRGYPMDGAFKRTVFQFPVRKFTAVYGLPSMNPHMVSYCKHSGVDEVAIIGDIKWNSFPNGKPDVQFSEYKDCGKIIWFYDGFTNEKTQDFLVHALARNSPTDVPMEVIIPYFADGTMERVDKNGTLATAQSALHSLCSSMPRKVTITVGDIHHTGTRFYTSDKVCFQDMPLARALFDAYKYPGSENIIVFPDDGAYKRYGGLFPDYTVIICEKMRQEDKRIVTIKDIRGTNNPTMPENKNKAFSLVIIDDIVRSGGTIRNVAELMRTTFKTLNITEVTALCVHADFNPGEISAFTGDKNIDRLVITNTCYEKAYKALFRSGPMKVNVYDFVKLSLQVCPSEERETFNLFEENNSRFVVLASASEEKLTGVMARGGSFISGAWTFDTPNFVGEQLFGKEEAVKANNERLNQLSTMSILGTTEIIAINSFAVDMSSTSGVAIMDRLKITTKRGAKTFETDVDGEMFPEPHLFTDELKKPDPKKRKVLGELLQKKYNLANKSAWIPRGKRVEQIKTGFKKLSYAQ